MLVGKCNHKWKQNWHYAGKGKPLVPGNDYYCENCFKKSEGLPQGRKDDAEKNRLELVPVSLIEGVGRVLTFGARKYDDRNWEAGIEWSRCYGALQRHLNAWWRGEDLDAETGYSHLWHAACELAFLIEFEETHRELDNRPRTQIVMETAKQLGEAFADHLNSRHDSLPVAGTSPRQQTGPITFGINSTGYYRDFDASGKLVWKREGGEDDGERQSLRPPSHDSRFETGLPVRSASSADQSCDQPDGHRHRDG